MSMNNWSFILYGGLKRGLSWGVRRSSGAVDQRVCLRTPQRTPLRTPLPASGIGATGRIMRGRVSRRSRVRPPPGSRWSTSGRAETLHGLATAHASGLLLLHQLLKWHQDSSGS
eukprot:scaffold310_cov335-Pavlova_lutheri.AAC.39